MTEKKSVLLGRASSLRRPSTETLMDDVDVMPTSLAQQRFWLLDQLDPGNPALNMPLALRLRGYLDVVALRDALNEVVERHEILRTSFVRREGKLVQVIATHRNQDLEIVDITERTDTHEEVENLMTEDAHVTFDLEHGPLFKTKLIKLTDKHHVLLLTLHHIICDGWSNGVLVREIGEIYNAFSQNLPSPCASLPIQYADFAVWQQQWLNRDGLDEELAFWKCHLGGELPVLDIPTDFPRNNNRASFGAIESLLLPPALDRAIKALSHRADVTPFMIFFSAYNVLLHRYTGQDCVLVGSPTANRNQSETEGLIGAFANTLLLKTDVSGDPSFKVLLARVKELALAAFSNQAFPFEKLVENLRPGRGSNRGQLFQAMFIFQTAFMQPVELEKLTIEPIRSVSPGSIFELSLGIVERGEGTRLQLEYNTDLFSPNTARCILSDLESVLQAAVLDSDRPVSELLQWTTPLSSRDMTDETTANAPSVEKAPALTPRAASRIEDTLREIWQDVLHVEAIGVEDDFFEIGGHSLLAVQIFDEITKRLGVNLPIASLFQATTIQQLAELVREATPKDKWTSLVPINTSGTKSPLFLMHAAGGNVLFYKDLASRLGAEQPCYGMQAVGLDGHQSAYERIEDMASHYIDEIMSVQPNGPYCLGGSSLGGLIAYEAAVQLKRKGHAVKLIALIDTWAPGFPKLIPGASRSTIKLYALFDRIQHHVETIRILESGRRFAYVAAKAVKAKNQVRRRYLRVKRSITGGVLKTLGRPLPEGLVSTRNAIQRAAREYSPQPARLDVVLFRATKHNRQLCVDDTLGWESFIQGKLEIQEVTGTHGSIIAEPRVGFVAEKLKELLERPDTARVTSHSDRESVHPFGIREGEKAAAV